MVDNKNFIGEKYNKWEVIDWIEGKKGIEWICRCECGEIKKQKVDNIKNGRSKMCKKCSNKEKEKEKKYEIEGEELSIKEIERKYGISGQLLRYRIKKGLSIEEAVRIEKRAGIKYSKRLENGIKI